MANIERLPSQRNTPTEAPRVSVEASQQIQENRTSADSAYQAPVLNPQVEAKQEAKDALQGVLQSVDFLVDAQDEHRNEDFRSSIPIIGGIWDMMRSHSIAGKEAKAIEQVRQEMAHLEQVVANGGLGIDLQPLKEQIAKLSPPAGLSKFLGSIFQGFRRFHREWYTPTVEDIRLKARDLQLQLRRSSGSQYSMAA